MPSTESLYLERLGRRVVDRLREDVEEWRAAHERLARDLWELEDVIQQGLRCLDDIDRAWERLKNSVSSDRLAVGGELSGRRRMLLRAWLEISKGIADLVVRIRDEYGDVEGADELANRMARIEDGLNAPHPVNIDAEGWITTASGEQVLMRGLEPSAVLKSLEDAKAGRFRSLKEVVDFHGRAGV